MTDTGRDAQDPARQRLRQALLDLDDLHRAVAAGRQRHAAPRFSRVELRPVVLAAGLRLQQTGRAGTQAFTSNHDPTDPGPTGAEALVDGLLAEGYGHWHVESASGVLDLRVTRRGRLLLHAGPPARAAAPPGEAAGDPAGEAGAGPDRRHDRAKERLLDPADPALRVLGLADSAGRIKPSRQDKVRQVEEFLRLLRADLAEAIAAGRIEAPTPGRPLRVVDLGCGNAYLTVGAAAWLPRAGWPAELVGVDIKEAARAGNAARAAALGWDDRVSYVSAPIASAAWAFPTARPQPDVQQPDVQHPDVQQPDVVLALHACDTATDDALARAVRSGAPLVLAAPCCHHELAAQLRRAVPPAGYRLVTRHGILRERWADVLTDALRAAVLRLLGYRVEVVEFVGSQHTPRNVLLRAQRTGAPAAATDWRDYDDLTGSWQVRPRLAVLLADELAAARAVAGLPTSPGVAVRASR